MIVQCLLYTFLLLGTNVVMGCEVDRDVSSERSKESSAGRGGIQISLKCCRWKAETLLSNTMHLFVESGWGAGLTGKAWKPCPAGLIDFITICENYKCSKQAHFQLNVERNVELFRLHSSRASN